MISSAFCKSAGFIPVKRLQFKPVNILSVRYEIDVSLNGSYKIVILSA